MQSTLQHAVDTLATFGVDVDPAACDPDALRSDAATIRRGETPLHLQPLRGPVDRLPRFAADLMATVADILEPRETAIGRLIEDGREDAARDWFGDPAVDRWARDVDGIDPHAARCQCDSPATCTLRDRSDDADPFTVDAGNYPHEEA